MLFQIIISDLFNINESIHQLYFYSGDEYNQSK